ncbi:alpha/beta fold hydrolase [Curtobacterium sp. VKM Ac-1376]|uniref:alpha/beta fold hydrolase n=1 Tax=Curtobacterium sp. VKM Ac-1376 TaxID=123312 RepID=UPI00188BF03D|nr:alpha/beta hydrolase family protein [Curtobacterium sp. VKM Ac-1376]MBF4616262.1 alpha/beta hydrolase [Curtobacterium sp. VKM Ac-1376]
MADSLPVSRERAVVFLHGSNRTFDRAWPVAAHLEQVRFAVMPGYGDGTAVAFDQDAWESALVNICSPGDVVVAHSYGGPIAMRAAARHPDLIAGLVLFEPAAYGLARGNAAVEAHIERVQPLLEAAAEMGSAQFAVAFAAAMTGTAGPPPVSSDELLAADRQRRLPGPWTLDTPTGVDVPMLVITGGWNEEYEAIASELHRARRMTLTGHGHRPQDHPRAAAAVSKFTSLLRK